MQSRNFALMLAAAAATATFAGSPAVAQNKGGGGSTTIAAGVIMIDQAKAEAGGVTAGDAPGFPVTISQPGSYRLMGNLTVGDPAVSAVVIASPNVTLDLNGFVIKGPVTCTGQAVWITCSSDSIGGGAARGHGVLIDLPGIDHLPVAVAGGTVTGFAGHGVVSAAGNYMADVHRMRIGANGLGGVSFATAVTESVVFRNGGAGLANVTRAMGNTITANRGAGMQAAYVRHNVSVNNGALDSGTLLIN